MRSNNSLRRNGKYRRSMRQILGFNFYDVFVFLFCIVFALVCVYPMWYVLVASVTPYEEYIKGGLMLWPTGGVDLQYYKAIFSTKSFTNSMWISVSKTVIATVLSVLVTASMAYGVSKVHVKGMKVINALVVFNLFFTGGLIPQYILYQNLGLLRNYWVMVIPGALNITYFIIMRNYYSYSVPKSLEEAALLDGCTHTGSDICVKRQNRRASTCNMSHTSNNRTSCSCCSSKPDNHLLSFGIKLGKAFSK